MNEWVRAERVGAQAALSPFQMDDVFFLVSDSEREWTSGSSGV